MWPSGVSPLPGGATTNWPNELKAPPPLATGSDSKHRVSCSLMAHGCNSGPPSFSNVPGGSSRACHGCPAQKLFRVNPNCRGGCRCWGGRISPQFNICTKLIDHVTLGGRGGSEYLAANFNQQPEKYSAEKSTSFDGMMDISVWPVD